MARKNCQKFHCVVVQELVEIFLSKKRVGGFYGRERPFVQCNQYDCQYVDENTAPCPLRVDMFADDLARRREIQLERLAWS